MTRAYRSGRLSCCSSPKLTGRPLRRLTSPIHAISARVAGMSCVVALALADAAGALEHAGAVAAEHVGEREQLVGLGVRARHRPAVGNLVQERAAGAEAQRAAAHRLVEQVGHRREVVGRRRSLLDAALAHRVLAQRAVADHAADVETLRHAVDRWRGTRRRSPSPTAARRGSRRGECPRRSPSSRPGPRGPRACTART